MYFKQLISLSDNKPKLCAILLRQKQEQNVTPIQCLENDTLVINPNRAAHAFNNYILEITEKLKLLDVHIDSGISYIMSHNSNHYPFMMVVPVTEAKLIV
jgi:hypothetical protein